MSQPHHTVTFTAVCDQDNPSDASPVDACQYTNSTNHAAITNLQTHTKLPPELWALIISFLASKYRNADLLSLLTVSRQIHALAEAELLRDAYLSVATYRLDDSRSPVNRFRRCIAAEGYRRRLVRSLFVELLEGEPFSSEIQALGELIPSLTNLDSLVLKFVRWMPSNHGSLGWLEEGRGMGEVLLRKLEILVDEAGPEGGLDVRGLLKTQPSVHDLTLSGHVQISGNDTPISLPQLKTLDVVFLYTPLRSLLLNGVVVMSTFVIVTKAKAKEFGGTTSVVMLTTMESQGSDPVYFNTFLAMVPSLGGLEAYMKKNNTMEMLSPLCHAKEREMWYPDHVTWVSHHSLSSDGSSAAFVDSSASRPSLRWVERALQPRLSGGLPRSLRWYAGGGDADAVVVKWEGVGCVYEVWRADWETEVGTICML